MILGATTTSLMAFCTTTLSITIRTELNDTQRDGFRHNDTLRITTSSIEHRTKMDITTLRIITPNTTTLAMATLRLITFSKAALSMTTIGTPAFRIITLSITALRTITLSMEALSTMTLSMMAFSLTTVLVIAKFYQRA